MPETDNTPENNKEADQKSENISTDDYFENVNKRLKKKNKGIFGRSSKKTPAPVPKVESPPESMPLETKVETPTPAIEIEPEKAEDTIEPHNAKAEPTIFEETVKVEQTAVNEETAPVVSESESKTQTVTEVKPKKKGFFSFLRKKPKEKTLEKAPLVEVSKESPNIETITVEQPLPIESSEPQPIVDTVEQTPPATQVWPPVEPVPVPVIVEEPSKPVAVEQVKPKKKGFFSFLRRKAKEPAAEKLTVAEVKVETPSIEADQIAPVVETENLVVTPEDAMVEPSVISEDIVDISQVNTQAPFFDGVVNIGKFTKEVKSVVPTKAVLSIGEYPIHLLLKSRFAGKPEGVLPLFIDKSSHDIVKWSQAQLNPDHVIGLDSDLDTHFWYNITPNMTSEGAFISRLKNKPIEQLQDAIFVASIWDGVGSALLPALIAQFNEWKINSVAVVFMPSKIQSTENQFNAFAALGKCSLLPSAPLVLVDRDNMENYSGVDRRGDVINGNAIANYLVDFMLSKESLVGELSELSKTFDSKLFTLMFATGASLKVYGSIENMLDTALFKPFLNFDLASTSLLYVLARVPYHLKEQITRGKVEMSVANWFKEKGTLQSIHVGEPVYIEDSSDRIDIALFIGGFETAKMFAAVEKRVNTLKNRAIKNGFLQEDEWKEIVKKLI